MVLLKVAREPSEAWSIAMIPTATAWLSPDIRTGSFHSDGDEGREYLSGRDDWEAAEATYAQWRLTVGSQRLLAPGS